VVSDSETRLTAADDHRLDMFVRRHLVLLSRSTRRR
jgi:hypothetical protein